MDTKTIDVIADALLPTLGTDALLPRVSAQYTGFSVDDGYAVVHRMRTLREARSEKAIGRKIGGTNPAFYHLTGATGPMWAFMYDTALLELPLGSGAFSLGTYRQPRIEPEIVLHISSTPKAGMTEAEIITCIDRVAFGYEIVHSPYSDWRVAPPDALAAFGLHQAMVTGLWVDITEDRAAWVDRLRDLEVTMRSADGIEKRGVGHNVLGNPLNALRAIVDDIARHPDWALVAVGEIITTGTIAELMPLEPGQVWTTTIAGAPLEGLSLRIT
ncbi:2-keto-4-pentenoate hydratase [Devosia sp.]|jgi:2-oxo-3-hexenedioate decarboxylase|uniref:2-keto-4-pentenoate hydratase n=1 Tax=Devosia sp. TaxID=1871048 RepID=UPI0037BFE562